MRYQSNFQKGPSLSSTLLLEISLVLSKAQSRQTHHNTWFLLAPNPAQSLYFGICIKASSEELIKFLQAPRECSMWRKAAWAEARILKISFLHHGQMYTDMPSFKNKMIFSPSPTFFPKAISESSEA